MTRILIALTIAAAFAAGCTESKESIESDTEKNAEVASQKSREALDAVGDAAASATAATTLTPRLKAAITGDAELNDSKNLINVDSNQERVTLDGHVTSETLRAKAERLVREEMTRANASQQLINNLVVKAAGG